VVVGSIAEADACHARLVSKWHTTLDYENTQQEETTQRNLAQP
jgi:hypothetical protein